jgi:hypothetical protein
MESHNNDQLKTLENYRDNLRVFIAEGDAEYVTKDFVYAKHYKSRGYNKFTVKYKFTYQRLKSLQNELQIVENHIAQIS